MTSLSKSQESIGINIALSAATGAVNMFLTNPLDSLRIRWQVLPSAAASATPVSVMSFVQQVIQSEGLWDGFWSRGLWSNCIGCACSVGVRLGFYPTIRDALAPDEASGARRPAAMLAAGLVAGAAGYAAAAPLFLVKTRLQASAVAKGSEQVGAIAEIRQLFHSHGLTGLWRGAPVLIVRGATLSASQTASYDWTKSFCRRHGLLEDGPPLHAFASIVAAFALTTAIIPLDVILTRYQTASSSKAQEGAMGCARDILRSDGPAGFLRGWSSLFVRMAPSSFMTFIIYEQLRKLAGLKYLS
eukprot:TRINITY_DN44065_c0_g1_i1.p1 TRINITY_DN44065_c0_g1~~TRINITY_DN44065_c0_g1_i1.p1  ORF type:complete len:301 (-),score=54.51 TRINITY_DN44065_c0_g1_i1:110-1012(-)